LSSKSKSIEGWTEVEVQKADASCYGVACPGIAIFYGRLKSQMILLQNWTEAISRSTDKVEFYAETPGNDPGFGT
jgi:hypothetical protein